MLKENTRFRKAYNTFVFRLESFDNNFPDKRKKENEADIIFDQICQMRFLAEAFKKFSEEFLKEFGVQRRIDAKK